MAKKKNLILDAETDPNRAPHCDPAVCVLPDCFCSEDGTTVPGDLPPKNVPMMITITFDDAINNNNINLYRDIFNGKRKNPNGCNIKATVSRKTFIDETRKQLIFILSTVLRLPQILKLLSYSGNSQTRS